MQLLSHVQNLIFLLSWFLFLPCASGRVCEAGAGINYVKAMKYAILSPPVLGKASNRSYYTPRAHKPSTPLNCEWNFYSKPTATEGKTRLHRCDFFFNEMKYIENNFMQKIKYLKFVRTQQLAASPKTQVFPQCVWAWVCDLHQEWHSY